MKIYRRKGVYAVGIGFEKVGIYEEETGLSYRKLHFKADLLLWHLHWDIRITRKTKT